MFADNLPSRLISREARARAVTSSRFSPLTAKDGLDFSRLGTPAGHPLNKVNTKDGRMPRSVRQDGSTASLLARMTDR